MRASTIGATSAIYVRADGNTGVWGDASTGFYADYSGKFSIADKVSWNPTTSKFYVGGALQATTVGATSAIYIKATAGAPAYADYNTPFFADHTGQFSLGDKLTWNGSTLSVTGAINVTGGNAATNSIVQSASSDLNAKIWTDTKGNLVAPAGAGSPSTAGLYLGAANLGYWNGTTWKTYMDASGNFFLNGTGTNYLMWNGNALTVSGAVNALSGNIGGWSIASDSINNGTTYIKGSGDIYAGRSTYSSGTGWFLGLNSGTAVMAVGNSGGNQLKWTGSQLEVTGGLYITDTVGIRKTGGGTLTITGGSSNGYPDSQIDLAGSNGDAVVSAGSSGAVQLRVGNAAQLTVSAAGKVGIGSVNASYKLTVDGTSIFTAGMLVQGDITSTGSGDFDGNVYSGASITLNAGTGKIDASTAAFTGNVDAASFTTTSSRRWKTNIKPIDSPLQLIRNLNGVRFDWNNKDLKNDIGLIAEEVNEVLPTLVNKDGNMINGVDYGRITALLIEAVKELAQKIENK